MLLLIIRHISVESIKMPGKTELCWGISSYGARTYTLTYKITNIINQYKDSQGLYFSFIPKEMEQKPQQVKIAISSANGFNKQNSQIWAFGYPKGTIQFSNNNTIVMDSKGALPSSNYMVALVKIQNGMFSTNNTISKNFDEISEEATSTINNTITNDNTNDTTFEEETTQKKSFSPMSILLLPIFFMFSLVPFILPIVILKLFKRKGASYPITGEIDFGVEGKKLPSMKEVNYVREIPCKKDLYYAYWVIYQYEITDKNTCKSGLLGAILLNWIKNGAVQMSKTKKGIFNFKDNNYAIDLTQITQGNNEVEDKLLVMLKKASGTNQILEAKEFQKWCKKNYTAINQWFREVITYETRKLEEAGVIKSREKEVTAMFGITRKISVKQLEPVIKEQAVEVLGLKRFLLEYSLIAEKEAIEVQLWEEYLIFAQLLGIADKVEEQFSKLYPEFNEVSRINTQYATICTREFAYLGIEAARVAQKMAEDRSSNDSYSSGGGGSSFSGGGSSSGGSSSGGGFR